MNPPNALCADSSSNPLYILGLYPPLFTRLKTFYVRREPFTPPSADLVKSTFFTLSRLHHPDKGGDIDRQAMISSAYDIFKNDEELVNSCVDWYNVNVIQASNLQKQGFTIKSASNSYVQQFIRLIAITDDEMNSMTIKIIACIVILATSLYVYWKWKKNQENRERERLIKKEKEDRELSRDDGFERSVLLRRIDEIARVREEEKEEASNNTLHTISILSYSTFFPSLQSSRTLLQTLKSNLISSEHSHLLPSILKNLLTNNVKYFKVNVQKDKPFYKHVYRYKCFKELLTNLGFESGDREGLGFNVVPERREVEGEKGVVGGLMDAVNKPRSVIKGKVAIGVKTGQLSISNEEGKYLPSFLNEPGSELLKLVIAKGCGFTRIHSLNNFKCLQKLDISRCPWLEGEIDLSGLENLTKVRITKTGLDVIPKLGGNVKNLCVSFSKISEVGDGGITNGQSLTECDLSYNVLGTPPKALLGLNNLKKIRLEGNFIEEAILDEFLKAGRFSK
ncbi:hypothetical protein TrLO_g14440 [Triparma laevis f. longispina]|uniref:J domain-containing protein n=1 Tax=Triparma laevis f. longispina TaxID=1714387 RepID=A0A9W7AFY7_9STRA|nr:hypothetical protein TrLO_g14440 [Triparma laevis f. longispina]